MRPKHAALERVESLRLEGRAAEAVSVLRQAIAAEPDNYQLHDELGEALCHLNRLEEGIGSFMTAFRLKPDFDEACYKIGVAFGARGLYYQAVAWFERAMKVNPFATRNLAPWGRALISTGCYEMAAKVFQQWVDAEPANPAPQHMLQAALGSREITRASADYVRELFDQHAHEFDENLAKLKYCAPEVLVRHLSRVAQVPATGWDVLDAGCGTGLAGVQLRRLARALVGVDLSPKMLVAARDRNIYDELIEADLLVYLREQSSRFDIIVAADVLPYLGELSEFFEASYGALRSNGFVAFVVEASRDHDEFRLNPTGRFSHHPDYLHREMEAAGLKVLHFSDEVCRYELDQPVPAIAAIASKVEAGRR